MTLKLALSIKLFTTFEENQCPSTRSTALRNLLDHAKVYLHAVIDNFSRKILAWCVAERFEFASTVTILGEASRRAVSAEETPTLVADASVENVNAGVDGLIESGLLRLVLALEDVTFSNSMIEA